MKIFFDSNVWRPIASPETFPNNDFIKEFIQIRQLIIDKKISPFIAKTAFTLEAIPKRNRQKILGEKEINIKSNEVSSDQNGVQSIIKFVGNCDVNFSNNPILKNHFIDAVNIGFKIIGLTRFGMVNNSEIDSITFQFSEEEFWNYMERVSIIVNKIEEKKAGKYHYDEIGRKYDHTFPSMGIKKAPLSESNAIAKAVAEWADGDSVASSIAIGCEYFCTLDKAKRAGKHSVFSLENLKWLHHEYGFETISPDELVKTLI